MKYSARGYKWTEKNVPVYYNSTCKVRGIRTFDKQKYNLSCNKQFLTPYVEIGKDLGKIALNGGKNAWTATVTYVNSKTPVVVKFVSRSNARLKGFITFFS